MPASASGISISMKDSPNGKRYGRRDHQGRITEAYGFDLSPLATRHAEFIEVAAAARAERAEKGQLRRRATIARNGIIQILETAGEYGFAGEEWTSLHHDSDRLARHYAQAFENEPRRGERRFLLGAAPLWLARRLGDRRTRD